MIDFAEASAADGFTEPQLFVLMRAYLDHRSVRDKAEKAMELAAKPIRDWLERHGGELYDGETRIKAALQQRKGSPELDAASLPDELLRWLADQHCLALNQKRYGSLEGAAAEHLRVRDYLSPGAGSQSLRVEKER